MIFRMLWNHYSKVEEVLTNSVFCGIIINRNLEGYLQLNELRSFVFHKTWSKKKKGGLSVMTNTSSKKEDVKKEGLWMMKVGEREASLKLLEDAVMEEGFSLKGILDLIRTKSEFREVIARAICRGNSKNGINYELAHDIMGDNFFGPEDWQKAFGVKFTKEEIDKISVFPWNEEILMGPCPIDSHQSLKDTHFAFLGLESLNGVVPLTLAKWHKLLPPNSSGPIKFRYNTVYSVSDEAEEATCRFGWYLMPKREICRSFPFQGGNGLEERKIREGQHPLNYEIPLTIEETTKIILFSFKVSKILRQPDGGAPCPYSYNVTVGCKDQTAIKCVDDKIEFHDYDSRVSIAASRKIE